LHFFLFPVQGYGGGGVIKGERSRKQIHLWWQQDLLNCDVAAAPYGGIASRTAAAAHIAQNKKK